MATTAKKSRRSSTVKKKKKFEKIYNFDNIYYNDGSGDNIPAIVGAMRKLDVTKAPLFAVK